MSGIEIFGLIGVLCLFQVHTQLTQRIAGAVSVIGAVDTVRRRCRELCDNLESLDHKIAAARSQAVALKKLLNSLLWRVDKYDRKIKQHFNQRDRDEVSRTIEDIDDIVVKCEGTVDKFKGEVRAHNIDQRKLDRFEKDIDGHLKSLDYCYDILRRYVAQTVDKFIPTDINTVQFDGNG
jgi:chromosome segregation ATPase